MMVGKGTSLAIAAVILTLAGANFYRHMPKSPKRKIPQPTIRKVEDGREAVLAAKEKYFPREVIDYLKAANIEGKNALAPNEDIFAPLQAHAIGEDGSVWFGSVMHFNNTSGQTITGEHSMGMGGYSDSACIFWDNTGELAKHRLVNRTKPPYTVRDMYLTFEEPLEQGEEMTIFTIDGLDSLKGNSNRYNYAIQNHPISRCLQQLVLILPEGIEIVEESEEPYSVEKIGDVEISIWQKIVEYNTNYRVDLVLERN